MLQSTLSKHRQLRSVSDDLRIAIAENFLNLSKDLLLHMGSMVRQTTDDRRQAGMCAEGKYQTTGDRATTNMQDRASNVAGGGSVGSV